MPAAWPVIDQRADGQPPSGGDDNAAAVVALVVALLILLLVTWGLATGLTLAARF